MKPYVNTLYEGDCISIMKEWEGQCIDACITDPPYNLSKKHGLNWGFSKYVTMSEGWDIYTHEQYLSFCRAWLEEVRRLVRPNGNIFIFGSFHNIFDLGSILHDMDLKIINSIVWYKPNAQPNITRRTLTESTEYIIWACNESNEKAKGWTFNYEVAKKLNGGKQMRNLWVFPYTPPTERRFGKHPSQKAISLIGRIVLIATQPGELILDCFNGSGTTPLVAQSYFRRWVAIEKDPYYNQIARMRLERSQVPLPYELTGDNARL